jgi:hypothetical protein
MPDTAEQIRHARSQLDLLGGILMFLFTLAQLLQLHAANVNREIGLSLVAAVDSARIELRAARADRIEATKTVAAIRSDLDSLMRSGQTRSIANRRTIVAFARAMRRELHEFNEVGDSLRMALPKRKR